MFIRDKKKSAHSNLKIAVLYPLYSRKCSESSGNFAFPIDSIFSSAVAANQSRKSCLSSQKKLSTGFTGSAEFLKPKAGNWETILVNFMPKKFVPFRVTCFIGVLYRTDLCALCASARVKILLPFRLLMRWHRRFAARNDGVGLLSH